MSPHSPSFLQLVAEKYGEVVESSDAVPCFCDSVGRLTIELHRLVAELALDPSAQDSEAALEILVALAVTCVSTAEELVLPEIRGER